MSVMNIVWVTTVTTFMALMMLTVLVTRETFGANPIQLDASYQFQSSLK